MILISTILYITIAYLLIVSLYLLKFALFGALWKKSTVLSDSPGTRFTLLYPCYKNDEIALASIAEAFKQNYPSGSFEVVLIADHFKAESIEKARSLGAKVVEVNFETSTKAKALNKAIEHFPANGQFYLILDVDNVMEVDVLQKFDAYVQSGAKAIQGHRAAKNLDTPYAVLDAISEEINNTIFRKGQQAIGLTSALIGSGMAFEGHLFSSLISKLTAVGGFDKELEMYLIDENVHVHYVNDAIIYDEKVQHKEVMQTQRTRWISAQWTYFVKYFPGSLKALLRGRFQHFFKTIQLAILPRVLHLAACGFIAFLMTIQHLIFGSFEKLTLISIITLCISGLALLIAIPRKLYDQKTLQAILKLPGVMLSFFLILFKLKGANKTFIHTPHQQVKP